MWKMCQNRVTKNVVLDSGYPKFLFPDQNMLW